MSVRTYKSPMERMLRSQKQIRPLPARDAAYHQLHRFNTWHARMDVVHDRSSTLAVVAFGFLALAPRASIRVRIWE